MSCINFNSCINIHDCSKIHNSFQQLSSHQTGVAEGRWLGRLLPKLLKPTCAGCAGICEVKVPGKCRCRVDQNCMKNRGG